MDVRTEAPIVDLWYGTSGPPDAPIVLVGESWGAEEERALRPFVGSSGYTLDRILEQAGLKRNEILCTNTIAARPPGNQTWRFFEPKATYLRARIGGLAPSAFAIDEVGRLYRQLSAHPRRLVIATGNYALWALSRCTGAEVLRDSDGRPIPLDLQTWGPNGIMKWRGSMLFVETHPEIGTAPGVPLLPIVHPAAIQRQWPLRDPTIHDLKARVPKALKGDWRPAVAPVYLAPPTFDQAITVLRGWWTKAQGGERLRLAVDIETRKPLITCLGIANSASFAMSIPFVRPIEDGLESYWEPTHESHITHLLRLLLSHPNVEVEGQNFLYDTQYIQHYMAVSPPCAHDTMLCQNVLFPGTPKDLGYLSSLYCDYHWYWKEDGKEWDTRHVGLEALLQYNCQDCTRTWEIAEAQRELVKRLGMTKQMQLKMDTHHMCLRMINRGVLIDKKHRHDTLFRLHESMTALERELLTIIPQEMVGPVGRRTKDKSPIYWYTSDKQTKHLFYDILGFRTVRNRKTGNPTTGKEALWQFKKWHPEFSGLINRLDTYGSVDNTVQVLRTTLDPDGRMRCSYNPGGTETHRLSSSENVFGRGTNLQNLTKGEEDD